MKNVKTTTAPIQVHNENADGKRKTTSVSDVTAITIEQLVNDKVHHLKEQMSSEARELFGISLKIDQKIKDGVSEMRRQSWWFIGIFSTLLSIAAFLGIPKFLDWHAHRIEAAVTEKFVSDSVQQQLVQFTDGKVAEMISASVSNAEIRITADLQQRVATHFSFFQDQSAILSEKYKEAFEVLELYEKCFSAKAGNRDDYEYLLELSGGTNRLSHIAATTVEEIKKSYEQMKNTFGVGRMVLINRFDKNKPIAEDVMIYVVFLDSIGQCDGAINSLADKGDKKYTATLMHAIEKSKHLDFVYAAIRGIEKLTGESFPALGIDETLDWWGKNKSDEKYHCLFEQYQCCSLLPNETPDDFAWRKAGLLLGWIKEMPEQYYSASQLSHMVLFAKVDDETAKTKKEILEFVLDYWESESPLSDNWYIYKTMYLAFYDSGRIIDFVNQRLETHPQFEDELKNWQSVFMPEFFAWPEINWPSKKNKE